MTKTPGTVAGSTAAPAAGARRAAGLAAWARRWPSWRLDGSAVLICAVLTALGYLTQVQPAFRLHAAQAQDADALITSQQEYDKLNLSVRMLRRELEDSQKELTAEPFQLEPASKLNDRLSRITDLASRAGLVIQSMEPGDVTPAPGGGRFKIIPLSLGGEGTLADVATFLHELRAKHPDIAVVSLELIGGASHSSGPGPSGRGAGISFRFRVLWHVSPVG